MMARPDTQNVNMYVFSLTWQFHLV